MTLEERYKMQKGIETPQRLKSASNSEYYEIDAIDNYIQNKIHIREYLQEQEIQEQLQKEILEEINKEILKEFEDTFR